MRLELRPPDTMVEGALVKYDLQQLGPTGFEDVAAALAVATFGAGVQVMGGGRDGGPDMDYRGSLVWAKRGLASEALIAARAQGEAMVRLRRSCWAVPSWYLVILIARLLHFWLI
jgi:hypothetical protein